MDWDGGFVFFFQLRLDLFFPSGFAWDWLFQRHAVPYPEFDCCPMEPGAMLGSINKFNAPQNVSGSFCLKALIESRFSGGGEIVLPRRHTSGIAIKPFSDMRHYLCPGRCIMGVPHWDEAFARLGFCNDKYVRPAFSSVLLMLGLDPFGVPNTLPALADQLRQRFIQT